MVANIVDHILTQCNRHPFGQQIKRLLFLKLEMELNASRCTPPQPTHINKNDTWAEEVTN